MLVTEATCPICACIEPIRGRAVSWAQFDAALDAAEQVPCRCAAAQHIALWKHPHARPGCLGYGPLEPQDAPPGDARPPCGLEV
jgi:hypothetical protein